jgi:DNA-binding transcriptional LysR family regulator
VGITESASFNLRVPATFRSFRAQFPDVEVTLEEEPSTGLASALREGRIDVAFLRPPLADTRHLSIHALATEAMVAAVPLGHRLAGRTSIALRALADEDFILYPRAVRPGLADAVVAACQQAGFTPRVVQYAPQLSSTINLVAASMGISIVPASMRGLQPEVVVYLPLKGRPLSARLGIAHRVGESAPPVLQFVESARRSMVVSNHRAKRVRDPSAA